MHACLYIYRLSFFVVLEKLNTSGDGSIEPEVKDEEEGGGDPGNTPALTVLLHGSLKIESMTALVKLA